MSGSSNYRVGGSREMEERREPHSRSRTTSSSKGSSMFRSHVLSPSMEMLGWSQGTYSSDSCYSVESRSSLREVRAKRNRSSISSISLSELPDDKEYDSDADKELRTPVNSPKSPIDRLRGIPRKSLNLSQVNEIGMVHYVQSSRPKVIANYKRPNSRSSTWPKRKPTEGFIKSLKSLLDVKGENGALSGEKLSQICPNLQDQKPKISLMKRKFVHWWDVIAPQIKVDVALAADDGTFNKENFKSELHLDQYLGLAPRTMRVLTPRKKSHDFKVKELELLDQMSRDELLIVIATLKFQEQATQEKSKEDLYSKRAEQHALNNMSIDELMNVATTLKSRVSFLKTFKRHLKVQK